MSVTLKEYSQEELAAQPIGAWTGMACRMVVGALREQLAVEDLTQPHWWTLNHVAGEPGKWTRATLIERLAKWDDLGIDFNGVFDDLVDRGWLAEDAGLMTLTEAGENGRVRAKERNLRVHQQVHEGIDPADFVTTINVLRRMVANLGGDGDLPD
ncbi:MarR family transcriptional regulator [Streptomyces sp. CL12-4]|uniref:MarR family transcriptional regulator n=1 Tax=Streptomyces sp. CL12-4 TaxID=2810306 RepID=UPI001EFA6AE5|nr:MarR family transcriptional regulator [Streptomyces sp. CL12-4]MCG8965865.1 MarR family transcriptional regulator [Streptomyces sp. CL12-4]